MKGLEAISKALFEKIRSRFPRVEMGDENGTPTQDESQARFFDFDYVVDGENKGAISISINEVDSLKLYFSTGMLDEADERTEDAWYEWLKEMRFFAKKHMMTFDAKDIAKSNLDKRDYNYLANKVQESKMYGTTKSSYEELDKTKLIIRHKKEINAEQMGARTRHIQSLFVENEQGERFKYPYSHLAGARAMARHVANGGTPHDDFGKHIIETSSNIAKLSAFKRYVQNKDFMNQTSNDIIEGANIELENSRAYIKKLQGQNFYKETFENYSLQTEDTELGEDTITELQSAFTLHSFNEDLTDMFPLLNKIRNKHVQETTQDLDSIVSELEAEPRRCHACAGTGTKTASQEACPECKGRGYVKEQEETKDNQELKDDFEAWADEVVEGEDDTTDVTIDKDGAMKMADQDEEPKDEKASTEEIIEFVRSFYDKETGAFPKGETGVVISARKRFGDSVGDLVEKFVNKLTGNKVELEDEQHADEGNAYAHAVRKAKMNGKKKGDKIPHPDDDEEDITIENPAEGFSPEQFQGEFDYDGVGDDGEETPCVVSYTAHVDENGKPVVDPKSIKIDCVEDGNSKLGFDADMDLEMQDMDELMQAAQEDAEETWNERDDKYAHGEGVEESTDLDYIKDKLAKILR